MFISFVWFYKKLVRLDTHNSINSVQIRSDSKKIDNLWRCTIRSKKILIEFTCIESDHTKNVNP